MGDVLRSSHSLLAFSDFTSSQELDDALAAAAPRDRPSLVMWQYCLLKLEHTGEPRPRYDLPFNFMRFLRVRPLYMALRWSTWVLVSAAFFLDVSSWDASYAPLHALFIAALVGAFVWDVVDTISPKARAMRKVWSAVTADEMMRHRLLAEAVRLDTQA